MTTAALAPALSPADVAAVYARQSKGKDSSIEQQIAAGTRIAGDEGWTLSHVYEDGTSASRFATKGRPGWERLLADLTGGRFGVLILWESSRGDRDLPSWVAMLAQCRERGIRIYVVSHERLYDCRIARDWKSLVEDGTDSAYESEKTSVRMKRSTNAMAEAGRPHGMVAYGYRRVREYDEHGRMIDSRDELHPEQADVIREAARRLLAGESVRSIARSLNEQGKLSPKGTPWGSTTLRQVLLRDRNAGLRTHRGRAIGRGKWEPIYDEATHNRIRAILLDPSRLTGTSGKGAAPKHLLSGIARCGRCGGKMRSNPGGTHRGKTVAPRYQCADCLKVTRSRDRVEGIVEPLIVARLQQPDALRALASGRPERAEELDLQIREAQARLDLAADDFADGTLTGDQLRRINAKLMPQIEAWRAELATCAPRDGLLELLGNEAEQRWQAAPLDVKRSVVDMLATITILPIGSGKRFNPGNVEHLEDGRVAVFDGQLRVEWKS